MKTFRLLATALLVAVCVGFISCEKDDAETESYTYEEYLSSIYGINPNDYEFLNFKETNGKIMATGLLPDQHLWIGVFDTLTCDKLYEIKDKEITEKEINNQHVGYGEYVDLSLQYISPCGLAPTENGFIAQVNLEYSSGTGSFTQTYIFFKGSELKKVTSIVPKGYYFNPPIQWYKDAAMLNIYNGRYEWACCKDNGDTIYTTRSPFFDEYSYFLNDNHYNSKFNNLYIVSYTDVIQSSGLSFYRTNITIDYHKVWSTDIIPPFEVPDNTQRSVSVLENTSNIWKCKVDYLFYDGTQKEYTFYLNIDDGTISESPNV